MRRATLFGNEIKREISTVSLSNHMENIGKNKFIHAANIPAELIEQSRKSVKILSLDQYFETNSALLSRLITHTSAINTRGDQDGYLQNGEPNPGPGYFKELKNGDPRGLSPNERLLSSKKIIFSNSMAFAHGGYPYYSPREILENPFNVGIFSIPAPQFEMDYLHYRLFAMDPLQQNINELPQFSHYYKDSATNFAEASKELGEYDLNADLQRMRINLFFVARDKSGSFYLTPFKKNAIIFNKTAYTNSTKEEITLLLKSVDKMAAKQGKPAYLKATGRGLGFYANINADYSINHYLLPLYLKAFKEVLEENNFPNIGSIEFPIFNDNHDLKVDFFNMVFDGNNKINNISVHQSRLDLLDFTDDVKNEYYPCTDLAIDNNAFPGNELNMGSTDSSVGNNTTLRLDQVWVVNPRLLDPNNHISIESTQTSRCELKY